MDNKYERITITLPQDVLQKFREFCKRNGINMSSRISLLVEKDLKEKNPLK
jgi:metal-responsive CopG/Arc/MetJ family transcriptional regulator|tara:strand:- start:255 stop:407 length:153 start_codon:yes stop_codon:yes gene_type:complete